MLGLLQPSGPGRKPARVTKRGATPGRFLPWRGWGLPYSRGREILEVLDTGSFDAITY